MIKRGGRKVIPKSNMVVVRGGSSRKKKGEGWKEGRRKRE